MDSTFDPGKCETIRVSFDLFNVLGFIPLLTRVYLETPNGSSIDEPIAVTPPLNTEAKIPLTEPFIHYQGLLYFETWINYGALDPKEVDDLIKKLRFLYVIHDCNNKTQQYDTVDHFHKFESKKLIYFTKNIDLL